MTFATTSSFAVVGEAHGTQLTIARPLFQWPSFLAATIYFPATPPSPPSESAAAKRQQSGGGYARLLPTSPQAAWWYRPTQVVFKNWELYIIGIITSHQLQYCWCLCNTSVVILREVGTIKIDLQDSEVGVMLPNRPSIGTHPPWEHLLSINRCGPVEVPGDLRTKACRFWLLNLCLSLPTSSYQSWSTVLNLNMAHATGIQQLDGTDWL